MLQERTLCRYLFELAQNQPGKKLVSDENGWISASGLLQKSLLVCNELKNFGIHFGDIVALKADRSLPILAAIFGIRLAGGIVLLCGPYGEPEDTLRNCQIPIPAACCVSEGADGALWISSKRFSRQILQERNSWFQPEISRSELLRSEPLLLELSFPEDADLPGFIIFTSGSTGQRKAVMLSDRNLIANLLDSAPLGDYREDDIALGVLPLEHVFGLVLAAGVVVLHYAMFLSRKNDVTSILSAIEQEKITRMNGVPSLYQAMAKEADHFDLSSLRSGFIGGAPVTPEQFRDMERTLGMTLISVYGMSECIGISCSNYREAFQVRCSTAGKVYPHNTVYIVGEDGKKLPAGECGEIWVNGPSRMAGYWPYCMDPEEFFPTGDLGYLTGDGHLVLTGRKKDIIIRNGNNISPARIESAMLSLAGVCAAAVVGLPDEKQGEVPYAMVAGNSDWEKLKELLPKNQLPAGILCVQELPMTPSGKADKQKIRELLLDWLRKRTCC